MNPGILRRCEDYEIFMRLHGMGCYGYNLQKELFCYREERASFKNGNCVTVWMN